MSILIFIFLIVLGLIAGSLINALVWRLSQQLDDEGNPKKLSNKDKVKLSITKGRSMCPHCQHQLAPKDLVPVFSWLSLKGKCRYCKKPISKQYPVVELITAVLFSFSYIAWPFTLNGAEEWVFFAGFLATLTCLIAMAIYDIKHTILPSSLIYIGIGIFTVGLLVYSVIAEDLFRMSMAFLAAFTYFFIFLIIYLLSYLALKRKWSNKPWLGFGDVRLAFLLGLIAGDPLLVFFAMFSASLVGIIVTLPSIINKKITITSQIPFGPFLIAGALITLYWGNLAMEWYVVDILGL